MRPPIDLIAIHRIDVTEAGYPNTASGIHAYFRDVKRWTWPAYTAVLWSSTWWQWAGVGEMTNHGGKNWTSGCVSLACVGDYRTEDPAPIWRRAVETAAELCWALDLDPYSSHERAGMRVPCVAGHSELATAEGRVWRCPGERWDMDRFRLDVAAEIKRLRVDLPPVSPGERLQLLGWR